MTARRPKRPLEMKPTIAILSPIWPDTIARLQQAYDCRVAFHPGPDEPSRALAAAEIIVMRSPVRLDAAALATAPRLRLIIRAGMGLEGIDLECARRRGIAVVLTPLSAESVAEHIFGLMLSVARRIPQHHAALRAGRWEKHGSFGWDLRGRTVGLVGFGRIGRRAAEIARAFGMRLAATDRSPEKPAKQSAAECLGVRFLALEDLLRDSDIVSIQTPLTGETRGLLDAQRLARMKPGAVLINVGRGGIVDEAALCEALRSGHLGGAALDVFAQEPPGFSPLLALDNFVGTPHVAAQTLEVQREIGETVERILAADQNSEPLSRWGVCP